MRRFERRHVGAIPAGGTILIGLQLDLFEHPGPNGKVAGENPARPTNLLRGRPK